MFASSGSHLLIFARQFASMIGSNLRLIAVLDNLARETPHRRLRTAVADVAQQVTVGSDLADALERHQRLFGGVFIGLVRSGLEVGCLPQSLMQIVEYLDRVQQVNRRVSSAAIYPAFVLLTFCGVASGMMFMVLPQYQKVFAGFNKPLPGPTQFLLTIGDGIRDNGAVLGGMALLIALSLVLMLSSRDGRLAWDWAKLRVPLFGPVWRLAALARFSRTLAVQTSNYVPIIRALRLSASASGNTYVQRLVGEIADEVEMGSSVTMAFRRHAMFAGVVLQMIGAGEEAGRLDELLLSAANYFDSLLMQRIDTLTGLINPALTGFVGISTAGMMVASFLPVFELPGALQ